jgi:iron complex outermembrane receptor protein
VATRQLLANSLAVLLAAVSLEASSQVTTPDQTIVESTKPSDSTLEPLHAEDKNLTPKALEPITIKATRTADSFSSTSSLSKQDIASQRIGSSDSARLLQDIPGVSLYGAGGISSLPVIHGLADDRLRTQVDGMDLMPACPNHMNPALSFINPTSVASVEVFAGITPVSVGGDSIGGTIQVKSAAPKFAKPGEKVLISGEAGYFFRSNGNARGPNVTATLAGENVSMTYTESRTQSDNYKAAADFKKPGKWQTIGLSRHLSQREVGASEYSGSQNRNLGLAWRLFEDHLLELNVSEQRLNYEGFPNQRMDMVASVPDPDPDNAGGYVLDKGKPSNVNKVVNLHYTGQYQWGELEARVFRQELRHHMDMLQERYAGMYMPMDTQATTMGGLLKASIELSKTNTLRVGSDFQNYHLNDWWPPIGGPAPGIMCCNDFWNVRDGKRDRVGFFGEWETRWNPQWLSLFGIRGDIVQADAGLAQGYSNGSYRNDAKAFNARDHLRTDHNLDRTALTRYTPDATQTYEAGFAQKSRSPNLYERYPWSTFPMAALMNNFVGDGNGYVGNLDLKPEVAYTFSGTIDWHDADKEVWGVKATGYVTMVDNFIDAQRKPANVTTKTAYVILQYVNQSAQLYGVDLSGHRLLGRFDNVGSFIGSGVVNYVMGENRTTGDSLYHIMPLNAKFSLVHRLGGWTTTAEIQSVSAKTNVSHVRNEVPTPGYSLFNLRSSYEFKHIRLDVGVENVFNKFYYLPLGGAYVGQGNSMTTNGVPWGMVVPGMGRSVNIALNMHF